MTAFTPHDGHRRTRLFGTHGSVEGDGVSLRLVDFRDGHEERLDIPAEGGHGGGDAGLVAAFVAAVADGNPGLVETTAADSLASHLVVWAAERARRTGTVQSLR